MTQSELTDRLRRVERETIHDGKCYAEITEIVDTGGGGISLNIELPTGRVVSESFAMPQTASTDYAFVRFLRSNGLTLGEADRLEGKEVPAEVEGTTATLDVPEPDRTLWERIRRHFETFKTTDDNDSTSLFEDEGDLMFPVFFWPITMSMMILDHNGDEFFRGLAVGSIGAILWFALATVVVLSVT